MTGTISPPHILIIDDDTQIRTLLQKFLEKQGWNVSVAENAENARGVLTNITPDLIILDVMMPNETGVEFLQKYRQKHNTPVLMLTAKTDLDDKVNGLLAGANDYLTKPFEPNELADRIKAILRQVRSDIEHTCIINIGDIKYDCERGILTHHTTVEKLTNTESRILNVLCASPKKVFSSQDIISLSDMQGDEHTLDVHIENLRKKIEQDFDNPIFLPIVKQGGYTLHI